MKRSNLGIPELIGAIVLAALMVVLAITYHSSRSEVPDLTKSKATADPYIDPSVAQIRSKEVPDSIFYRYSGMIYDLNRDHPLPDVSTSTFTLVSFRVGKDSNHVYLGEKIQPQFDAGTFENYFYYKGAQFYKDKNGIYFFSDIGAGKIELSPFDPKSAKMIRGLFQIGNLFYSVSPFTVKKIEGIDIDTYHILGSCIEVEMSGADYAADNNNVYVEWNKIEGADPETFENLMDFLPSPDSEIPYAIHIWRDKNHIYAPCGEVIKEADYNTYKSVGHNTAEDKNNTYFFTTGGGYSVKAK